MGAGMVVALSPPDPEAGWTGVAGALGGGPPAPPQGGAATADPGLAARPPRPPARPGLAPPLGPHRVDDEVDGPQLVGLQRPGVLDGPGGGQVETVDEDEDDVTAQDRGAGGGGHVALQLIGLGLVLAG